MSHLIGIFGGTFDPFHLGHLFIAEHLLSELSASRIILVPSGIPVHRESPKATAAQRHQMIRLGVLGIDKLSVDDREIIKSGPSFTYDTLKSFREEFGNEIPLAFILGEDAFLGFQSWYLPLEILKLAHLVIVPRLAQDRGALEERVTRVITGLGLSPGSLQTDAHCLNTASSGFFYVSQQIPPLISSSEIRTLIGQKQYCEDLLTSNVATYIRQNGIYTPRE